MATAIATLGSHNIITFDVWNTLIKANPNFSYLRTVAIADAYGINKEEAAELYTSVKFFLDQSAEIAMISMSTPECWNLLNVTILRHLRKQGRDPVTVNLAGLRSFCDDVFRKNLPIFTQDTADLLVRLKEGGRELGIISNTNFISGDLLFKELFAKLKVFDCAVFSDSFGKPKPHGTLFNHVTFELQDERELTFKNRLHVGDNLICDGRAERFGYDFQPVDNPDDLVKIFTSIGL